MQCSISELLAVCKYLATDILSNGGETYRAEECILRVCSHFGFNDVDVMAFPTGVTLSIRDSNSLHCYSETCRIMNRSYNLRSLNKANDISRRIVNGTLSLEDAKTMFASAERTIRPKKLSRYGLIPIFAAAFSSAFFAVLFEGKIIDFLVAFVCSLSVQLFLSSLRKVDSFHFMTDFLASIVASVVTVIFLLFCPSVNAKLVIIGAVMPFFPGLPMTNAIRDTINGDLIAGISRFAEVILVAICLASGVGIVLAGYIGFGGTIVDFNYGYSAGFVLESVQTLLFCFFATFFFAILLSAPGKSLVPSALIASIGFYFYFVFDYFGQSIFLGCFIGTVFIAASGEILARIYKMPANIFVFPAVIPLVPGIWLYETMLFLVQGDYTNFALKGTDTLFFSGVMAGALAVTNFLFRMIIIPATEKHANKIK